MSRYAILCGSAPDGYRQKKLVEVHNYLTSKEGLSLSESNIILFPNGVPELMLESALNGVMDEEADEVWLYIFAQSNDDLNSLSEYEAVGYGKLEVVRLYGDEIRKEVIEYYQDLFNKLDSTLNVVYDVCSDFVSEEELGYERV